MIGDGVAPYHLVIIVGGEEYGLNRLRLDVLLAIVIDHVLKAARLKGYDRPSVVRTRGAGKDFFGLA
jgi:hypothetical protein